MTHFVTPLGIAVALAAAAIYFLRSTLSEASLRYSLAALSGVGAVALAWYAVGVQLPKVPSPGEKCLVGLWALQLPEEVKSTPFDDGILYTAKTAGKQYYRYGSDHMGSFEATYTEYGKTKDGADFQIDTAGKVGFAYQVDGDVISYSGEVGSIRVTSFKARKEVKKVIRDSFVGEDAATSDSFACREDRLEFKNSRSDAIPYKFVRVS